MRHLLLGLSLGLVACGDKVDDDGDDTGDDGGNETTDAPHCEDTETALSGAEETPLGITGDDLLAALPATGEGSVLWADGPRALLSFGVSADTGTLRFVSSTEVYPSGGGETPAIAVYCPDYLAVDGVLQISSDDGRLAESLPLVFSVDEDNASVMRVVFGEELDPDALGGSLDLSDFVDPADYDSLRLFISGELQGGTLSGGLSAQGEGSDGDVAWAENIEIGTFDGTPEEPAE